MECPGCQREAHSKCKKTYEVIPPDLTQLAPAESISIDYACYNNQNILVIKDRSSGFIGAVLTKDQSSDESVRAMMTWFHSYGFRGTHTDFGMGGDQSPPIGGGPKGGGQGSDGGGLARDSRQDLRDKKN